MNAYTVKSWTGPAAVKETAEKLRAAGFQEVTEGTEHIYCKSEGQSPAGAAWNAQVDADAAGLRWLLFRPA
jgi:hypothetical protein